MPRLCRTIGVTLTNCSGKPANIPVLRNKMRSFSGKGCWWLLMFCSTGCRWLRAVISVVSFLSRNSRTFPSKPETRVCSCVLPAKLSSSHQALVSQQKCSAICAIVSLAAASFQVYSRSWTSLTAGINTFFHLCGTASCKPIQTMMGPC